MGTSQLELPETRLARRAPDPLEILQAAVEKNLNPETLKQLMDLQERYEANEAKKEFVEAMNQFKANPPTITKNKHVKAGQMEYDHATLDHVCDEVTSALSAHGISHRWKVSQNDKLIKVTCVLTHRRGHSEETTLEGPADTSGSKNAIQAIGSSVTYLQRYTLLAATGLASKYGDNDGAGGNGGTLDDIDGRIREIEKASDLRALMNIYKVHYEAATKANDGRSLLRITQAKDKRKEELEA